MWYRLASFDTDKPVYAELYCCGGITKRDFDLLKSYGRWLVDNDIDDYVVIGSYENGIFNDFADVFRTEYGSVYETIGTIDNTISGTLYRRKVR